MCDQNLVKEDYKTCDAPEGRGQINSQRFLKEKKKWFYWYIIRPDKPPSCQPGYKWHW